MPTIPPDYGRTILSSVRWVIVIRTLAQTFTWLSTIIVVRFISPEDYGLNAMLQAPLELMMLLCTFGIEAGLVRAKTIEREQLQSAFGWLLVINFFLFSTYYIGGELLALHFSEPRLETLAKALAFVFILVPFRAVPNALLDRELKFKAKATVELISAVAAAIITLALAILGKGIWALIIGAISKRVIAALILMLRYPWFIKPTLSLSVKPLVRFGSLVTLSSLLLLLSANLVNLIAGPLIGPEQLGIYAVALQFAMLPLGKTMTVLSPVIYPAFSRLQDHPERAGYYLQRALSALSAVIIPITIGIACVASEFVTVILGTRWIDASIPLALISLIVPFRMITYVVQPVTNGMGRPTIPLRAYIARLALAALALPVAMDFGVVGLAAMWIVIDPVVTFVILWLSKPILSISATAIFRLALPSLVSACAMAVGILALGTILSNDSSPLELVVKIVTGAIIYVLMYFVFFRKEASRITDLFLNNTSG